MTTVLNPCVFITNDYTLISKFFNGTKVSIDNIPTSPNSLFISNKKNKYLQSLEYSVNFDKTDIQKLSLEFIDTDGNLEQALFLAPQDGLRALISNKIQQDATNEIELTDTAELFKEGHRVYIAFGTGDDLSLWSDPMCFIVNKLVIDIGSNGLRKYKFTYYPSNSVLFRPRLQFNLGRPNPQKEFFFLEQTLPYVGTVPFQASSAAPSSIDKIIYDITKNYISNLTATRPENIIGILPKLDLKLPMDVGDRIENFKKAIENYFGIQVKPFSTIFSNKGANQKTKQSRSPKSAAETDAESTARIGQDQINQGLYYTITANNIKSSDLHPAFPDWSEPLNKINKGYKSIRENADDFVWIEENNLSILNVWKNAGLIGSATDRCIVFGLELLINEYLYRSYSPTEMQSIENIGKLATNFKPKFELMDGNEKEKLKSETYGIRYLEAVAKKKISSNFSEKVILDELASTELMKKSADVFKSGYLNLLDIPVFTHNLKNSNILNINLDNSELYFNGVLQGVSNNFSRFFFTSVTQSDKDVKIDGLSLSSVAESFNKVIDKISDNFESSSLSWYGGDSQKLLDKQYRIKLREILIQLIYYAKLEKPEDRFDDTGFALPEVQSRPPKQSDTILDQWYAGTEEFFRKRFRSRITSPDKLGISRIYSSNEIKQALDTAGPLLRIFDDYIISQNGDVNIDCLLMAEVVRQAHGIDVNSNSLTLEDQTRIFNHASLLFFLYDLDGQLPNIGKTDIAKIEYEKLVRDLKEELKESQKLISDYKENINTIKESNRNLRSTNNLDDDTIQSMEFKLKAQPYLQELKNVLAVRGVITSIYEGLNPYSMSESAMQKIIADRKAGKVVPNGRYIAAVNYFTNKQLVDSIVDRAKKNGVDFSQQDQLLKAELYNDYTPLAVSTKRYTELQYRVLQIVRANESQLPILNSNINLTQLEITRLTAMLNDDAKLVFIAKQNAESQRVLEEARKHSKLTFKPRNFNLSQLGLAAEILKYTTSKMYRLTLKTLPFFYITSIRRYLFRPCFVFSKKIKVTGTRKIDKSLDFDFFSGMYNIQGFKHVITTTECYSQFIMIKRTFDSALR